MEEKKGAVFYARRGLRIVIWLILTEGGRMEFFVDLQISWSLLSINFDWWAAHTRWAEEGFQAGYYRCGGPLPLHHRRKTSISSLLTMAWLQKQMCFVEYSGNTQWHQFPFDRKKKNTQWHHGLDWPVGWVLFSAIYGVVRGEVLPTTFVHLKILPIEDLNALSWISSSLLQVLLFSL